MRLTRTVSVAWAFALTCLASDASLPAAEASGAKTR